MTPLTSKSVVVSIHDVSPRTRSVCESMLTELHSCGIPRTSLLVIPDHHHRGHFLKDTEFCDWLRKKASDGHEAVIHGYFHERKQQPTESFQDRITTRIYTAGEGEFYDIGEETAYGLVTKAQQEFAEARLRPSGFIAPAWLLSRPAETALQRAGIHYTTRLQNVKNLLTGAVFPSQSMVYSVRSGWRRQTSLRWNAFLYWRLTSNPLLRIGLHPPDYQFPTVWHQILHFAKRAAGDRDVTTYGDWFRHLH